MNLLFGQSFGINLHVNEYTWQRSWISLLLKFDFDMHWRNFTSHIGINICKCWKNLTHSIPYNLNFLFLLIYGMQKEGKKQLIIIYMAFLLRASHIPNCETEWKLQSLCWVNHCVGSTIVFQKTKKLCLWSFFHNRQSQ